MRLLKTITFFLLPVFITAQHPITFFTKSEAADVKRDLLKFPLLTQSFSEIKKQVDAIIGTNVDVPFPKDPAGGYTHDKHKSNYGLMFNSGILYNLTGDAKYAALVRDILMKYASLNPTLKNHPQATSSSPGRIFWQALNDANWLVYSGMAYDLIYNFLSAADRKTIEDGAFKPEVDFVTKDLKNWFNLVHNHGVWACAGVGIVGFASNNKEYVEMALYGTEKNGKSGFLAQLDNLFSPDGYYTEGPYYVRYAILPFYLFANAIQHARPDLKIFEYRNRILQKALMAGLQQTNLDGRFFPLNDALKEKDYTSNELVTTLGIAWQVYGKDNGLLTVAQKQNKVLINKGGASIAAAISNTKNISNYFPYKPIEFVDGAKGDEGGISLLRIGEGKNLTTVIYKYPSHGLSHGHFDRLNINLFDKGNEILQDYGSVRFVNVEQKWGGRYLPENDSYAVQTIAHNTITVDETSQFKSNEKEAGKYHSEKLFSSITGSKLQVASAKEVHAYKDVNLQRTVYLLELPGGKKLMIDLFNVVSSDEHQYDLPFQYSGQVIKTSFKYKPATNSLQTLGTKNGYQFLWKEAEADADGDLSQFTFLNNGTYYTISSLTDSQSKIFFTRTGANDPDFNLRREPSYIIRKNGKDKFFLNVLEIHGRFSAVDEISVNSYPSVQSIAVLQNNPQLTVADISLEGKTLRIMQSNQDFGTSAGHETKIGNETISWTGPFKVLYDGKSL